MLSHVIEHGAQILEVDEQHALVICDTKDDIEHASLHSG